MKKYRLANIIQTDIGIIPQFLGIRQNNVMIRKQKTAMFGNVMSDDAIVIATITMMTATIANTIFERHNSISFILYISIAKVRNLFQTKECFVTQGL